MVPLASLTAARKKVYPRNQEGRFRKVRNFFSFLLQTFLFCLPWLQWDGRQAVLADLPGRKLYLFGLVLHPQDTYFLHLLLVSAAITLFTVSAVAGRMWCGYACPQTLFTQSFIMVERFFEGDRAARQRLDKSGWSLPKLARKVGKWLTWSVMGAWLGVTFAGYFLPIREVVQQPFIAPVLFFTLLSLFEFGYFREQFCNYLCPYARFQGAMLDRNSLIVGYDQERGEPRGKLKESGRGSCIDCSMCAQVCPAGIDIRNGLQLECIACAACIDACDQVMDKVGQPRGLVRYSSLQGLKGGKTRLVRPRLVVYSILLTGLLSTLTYLVFNRSPLSVDAVRAAGQLSNTSPDGRATNVFQVILTNRRDRAQTVRLSCVGLSGAELGGIPEKVELAGGEVRRTQVIVMAPSGVSRGTHPIHFELVSQESKARSRDSSFWVP
jgi:cytochrome c oxidase accessory protein FixG